MDILDQAYELRGPAVISDEVGGETLAINLDTGVYYVIPPAAASVWGALSTGTPARALLAGRGDADRDALVSFCTRLIEAGLLRPTATAADPVGPVEWEGPNLDIEAHDDMADLLGLDPIHDADDARGWPLPKQPG